MGELQLQINRIVQAQRPTLAEQIVARQYARQPEFWPPFGAKGRELGVRDVNYHFQFLTEALTAEDPSLFADYVAWVKVLFAGLHFPDAVMITTLACMQEVLHEALSAELVPVLDAYIDAGLQQMRQAAAPPTSFVSVDAPLTGLLRQYLDALLRGERQTASRLITDAVQRGADVRAIYLDVFQRSQYEIGRLWLTNQVSVAQEHYCTAATQLIMSQLYPSIFATAKNGRRLVATCVGGELHEIGMRMVADFFELDGWDTYYLGANTPTVTVLEAIADRRPDVLGISATMTFHISIAADLIERVRASAAGPQVKILVGGYPFIKSPELWRKIGADGFAPDAQGAIEAANALL